MNDEGWKYDEKFDWLVGGERGTLVPEEYIYDPNVDPPIDELYINKW